MKIINLLHFKDRTELRQWLMDNHCKEKCCWVVTYRGKCPEWSAIPSNVVAVGNPCRVLRPITDEDKLKLWDRGR